MNQLQSRTAALITGASSGIGYALAKVMARHGHKVVLVARNQSKLHPLNDELRQEFNIVLLYSEFEYSESLHNL